MFGAIIEYDPNALTEMLDGFHHLSCRVDAVTSGFRRDTTPGTILSESFGWLAQDKGGASLL